MRIVLDALRGALIGAAEIVPGVSGGTVALIVRVYQTIIVSASGVVRGVLGLLSSSLRAQKPWAEVHWGRIVPIVIGMFVAIFVGARFLEPLLSGYPVQSRAVFAGLILASLFVPITMVGARWQARDVVTAAVFAAISFILVGLPPLTSANPSLLLVAPAAALAVCALVLPGVSGSFLLLTLGMYEPTLRAVNERDFSYLGAFVLGAIIGLGSFVVLLQWFLAHRRRITLVVMTGLMAGSLRALWPWQTDSRDLLAPDTANFAGVIALFLAGVAVISVLLLLERVLAARRAGVDLGQ